MNVLELKGRAVEMLSRIEDAEDLQQVLDLMEELLNGLRHDDSDGWSDLPTDAQTELEQAIIDSENPDNWTSHEVVMQKAKQWLKK